jgi:hypothetical protein
MKYLIEVFWSDKDEVYVDLVPDLRGWRDHGRGTVAGASSPMQHPRQLTLYPWT